MGRTAEAVPSLASLCLFRRTSGDRHPSSETPTSRLSADRSTRAFGTPTVPALPNLQQSHKPLKHLRKSRPKPISPAECDPKTDPTPIRAASGGTSRDPTTVRQCGLRRSSDHLAGRTPTCPVPPCGFPRQAVSLSKATRPPLRRTSIQPPRPFDGPSRCLRAVFIFPRNQCRINKKVSRNRRKRCISFKHMHNSSTVFPQGFSRPM